LASDDSGPSLPRLINDDISRNVSYRMTRD